MTTALSDLGEAIGDDDGELAERKARELRRLSYGHLAGPRFASDDGAAPDPALAPGTAPVRAAFSRLATPSAASLAGGTTMIGCGPRPSRAGGSGAIGGTEAGLEPPGGARRGGGRPCHLHGMATAVCTRSSTLVSKNMLLDRGVESEISAVLVRLGKVSVKPQLLRQLPRTHGGPDGPPRGAGGQGGRAEAWRFPTLDTTTHGGT